MRFLNKLTVLVLILLIIMSTIAFAEVNEYNLIKDYINIVPADITVDLGYDQYRTEHNYVVLTTGGVNIRSLPSVEGKIIRVGYMYNKISLLGEYKGQFITKYDTDIWYKVTWLENGEAKEGYMLSALVAKRSFNFEKATAEIMKLQNYVTDSSMAYVSNYKNYSGLAPRYKGTITDVYGTTRSQSAPAYKSLDDKSEFIYLTDGTLLNIKEEIDSYYLVHSIKYDEDYFVPKKYITTKNQIETLNQVLVVDRSDQNQMLFEYFEGKWYLRSYVVATTGADDEFRSPTDLGYYMVIQKKPKFLYLDDLTREIDGYAPYTLRFNGGAYVHGVPVKFDKIDDELVDPGEKEVLVTLGTIPRSHKCVRNYTSHAKFLYNFVNVGQAAVIVIE